MPLAVRLTPKTERALNALARRRRQTRSDVVREAVEHYAASEADTQVPRPFDLWADVIGIVRMGVRTTGEQVTSIVGRKAHARRAR
jgi:predicted DNA-binding protein